MSNHSFRCFRKNKNDLTNQQKSRTIKVKRAHQQTVCSHCLWLRRNNRRELVAGAVISFSCRGDSDYYFYDYSKCTRSRWSNPAENCKSSANHLKWCIDPSYRSPPICSNEQWEQKSEKDLTAYRFRYALKIQYITLCKKCQTIVFSIKSAAFPGKKALDKCGVLTYNKDRKSTPVDGLLPLQIVKKI